MPLAAAHASPRIRSARIVEGDAPMPDHHTSPHHTILHDTVLYHNYTTSYYATLRYTTIPQHHNTLRRLSPPLST